MKGVGGATIKKDEQGPQSGGGGATTRPYGDGEEARHDIAAHSAANIGVGGERFEEDEQGPRCGDGDATTRPYGDGEEARHDIAAHSAASIGIRGASFEKDEQGPRNGGSGATTRAYRDDEEERREIAAHSAANMGVGGKRFEEDEQGPRCGGGGATTRAYGDDEEERHDIAAHSAGSIGVRGASFEKDEQGPRNGGGGATTRAYGDDKEERREIAVHSAANIVKRRGFSFANFPKTPQFTESCLRPVQQEGGFLDKVTRPLDHRFQQRPGPAAASGSKKLEMDLFSIQRQKKEERVLHSAASESLPPLLVYGEPILNKQFPVSNLKFFKHQPTYHGMKSEARSKYGVIEYRPQDRDRSLMAQTRRVNRNLITGPPENYHSALINCASRITPDSPQNLSRFSETPIAIVTDAKGLEKLEAALQSDVFSVDFEYYDEQSYDGFLAVASISTATTNFVIDLVYGIRSEASTLITCALENHQHIVTMCGAENDAMRLKKDWGCYPLSVVDIQDLFKTWKASSFDECLRVCSNGAIQSRLQSTKPTEQEIREYFRTLERPGLGFMMRVFFGELSEREMPKDPVATHADWAARPIDPHLARYAASDSHYTLRIFYQLATLVGKDGVRRAAQATTLKFLKVPKVSLHPSKVKLENEPITKRVLEWRTRLALDFDRRPQQILADGAVDRLSKLIKSTPEFTDTFLAEHLKRLNLNDDFNKSAKLLGVYARNDAKQLENMKNVICHNCDKVGHTAYFCPYEGSRESRQAWKAKRENLEKIKQAEIKRWTKYCSNPKRDWDPHTHPRPTWWSKGIPEATHRRKLSQEKSHHVEEQPRSYAPQFFGDDVVEKRPKIPQQCAWGTEAVDEWGRLKSNQERQKYINARPAGESEEDSDSDDN